MFTKPTIFSMNPATGQARCAGEVGDELIIGKETMLNMISQASGMQILLERYAYSEIGGTFILI